MCFTRSFVLLYPSVPLCLRTFGPSVVVFLRPLQVHEDHTVGVGRTSQRHMTITVAVSESAKIAECKSGECRLQLLTV